MMVMTAKVDKKKIVFILAAAALLIVGLIMLFGGDSAEPTAGPSMSGNDARVQFLKGFGWELANSPTESSHVKIPTKTTQVYERYNALQKSQGYDLTPYAGKTVMRYVYKIQNYPGATDPVYATLLVYKDSIIGGDITDTSAKGVVRGFQMPANRTPDAETTPVTLPQTTQ